MKEMNVVVTGVTGQVGSYLAELLLEKGYKVYGFKRRTSHNDLGNVSHLEKDIEIIEGDLLDPPSLNNMCCSVKPYMFFNLAAQSHVNTSFEQPYNTLLVNSHGPLNCLEAIKNSGVNTKFYQASTSEMFGGIAFNKNKPLNEKSPFHPRSPYGCSKLYGHWITVNYRESYGMFNCSGILFNNESPRRGAAFVTRKISLAVSRIKHGLQKELQLGNLNAERDWGHSREYVKGILAMMSSKEPRDYVLATGKAYSVKHFCELAFNYAGLGDYRNYVKVDPCLYRSAEVEALIGDSSKANEELRWKYTIDIEDLVKEMVDSDMELSRKEVLTKSLDKK